MADARTLFDVPIDRLLTEIEANQRAFDAAEVSWRRFIPLWRIRTQYRLYKANEPLVEALGSVTPALSFESGRGVSALILRRLIGA